MKSINELQTQRDKLDEMLHNLRHDRVSVDSAVQEADGGIKAEQAKMRKRLKNEYELRREGKKHLKSVNSTLTYLQNEIKKVDEQIKKSENGSVRKAVNQ